jgi:RNA polymerase sigma factor (sigma-70 family)
MEARMLTEDERQLVLDHLQLAQAKARQWICRGLFASREEALSTAYWCLIQAAQKYRRELGAPFPAWARRCIEWERVEEIRRIFGRTGARRPPLALDPDRPELEQPTLDTGVECEAKDLLEFLLGEISTQERVILEAQIAGLAHSEIGRLIGTSSQAVSQRMLGLRKKLKRRLRRQGVFIP